ncbi:MAG: glycosyltransferase family 9 protein [Bacteroidota bacterium]|nr:glycosyltransferase family 9 protein [Bacteroidota bacterium]
MKPTHIIISRSDKIGDVILTLPMAGVLKKYFPDVKISFLGNTYTEAIIRNSEYIDKFYNWDKIKSNPVLELKNSHADVIIHVFPNRSIAEAAKKANIKIRIGTSHRIFHWWTCNSLVNLGRKNSNLHEAQLNLQLMKPLQIETTYSLRDLPGLYGWIKSKKSGYDQILSKEKFNLILHTKSRGSAREWTLKNFYVLAQQLQEEHFNIILSGTKEEGRLISDECPELLKLPNVKNITGTLDLTSFIDFIKNADGLIACSTGPLHIASASGIFSLGLYPPIKPMDPGRWAPLGNKASYLVKDVSCSDCRKGGSCFCLIDISPAAVKEEIDKWYDFFKKNKQE